MVLLQPDLFLNEPPSMFERNTEKGSVWVTLKRSSLKSKVQRNKMKTAGETIEYRCLVRATDGKKTISTSYHAGANFGRTSGGPFVTTSYGFDAPIDEYGSFWHWSKTNC